MYKYTIVLLFSYVACQQNAANTPVLCSMIPPSALNCIGNPQIIDRNTTSKCSNDESIDKCTYLTCVFRNAGWLVGDASSKSEKVDKTKVQDHLEQFAKNHPEWSAAVTVAKTECLSQDLKPQSVYINCAPVDVVHCFLSAFLKNAGDNWKTSFECIGIKTTVRVCPACPSECFASAIPIGSCNACYAQPPTEAPKS